MKLTLDWRIKTFDELTNEELYHLLGLRCAVFVVEQRCCYLDVDNKDQHCHHLLGYQEGKLMVYSRIVPPGLSYEYASIGRIVSSATARGKGLGAELLNVSIDTLERLYGKSNIRIGAQLYLKEFYEMFGFQQSGDVYLEDHIEHIQMTRLI